MKNKHSAFAILLTAFSLGAIIYLAACSTAQLGQAQAIADPIATAMVAGYAQQYGVPPALTTAVLTPILNDGWGMLAQANAGNPIAQGAANPAIGATVAAANPTAAQLLTGIAQLKKVQSNPALASAILTAARAQTQTAP